MPCLMVDAGREKDCDADFLNLILSSAAISTTNSTLPSLWAIIMYVPDVYPEELLLAHKYTPSKRHEDPSDKPECV